MSDLETIQAGWNEAARQNAIGNILTDKAYSEEGFFEAGREDIAGLIKRLDERKLRSKRRQRAMDFGCGLGRLSVALTEHYKKVDGVDAAEEMILRAKPHISVAYHHNPHPDLGFEDDTFDLIVSLICLQHMPSELQEGYVKEFARVLHPKGTAVFQIPEGGTAGHSHPWLGMYGSDHRAVEEWAQEAGAEIVHLDDTLNFAGHSWVNYTYTMRCQQN